MRMNTMQTFATTTGDSVASDSFRGRRLTNGGSGVALNRYNKSTPGSNGGLRDIGGLSEETNKLILLGMSKNGEEGVEETCLRDVGTDLKSPGRGNGQHHQQHPQVLCVSP